MRTRTLTAEQKAARDARRARFSELAKTIGAMSETERAMMAERMAGAVTIEGRQLSMHNACLLACQNPNATLVGGFNQWRQHGRIVRKGEHGLMIWAPTTKRSEISTDAKRENSADDHEGRSGFIMVTVFDLSQTDELTNGTHA